MLGALAIAAQIAITVSAPDTVTACAPLSIHVSVDAPGTQAPRLVAPDFGAFSIVRLSTLPRRQRAAERGIASTDAYRYDITTPRTGNLVIPPFEARVGPEIVRSRPLHVVVRPATADTTLPDIVRRARIAGDTVNFDALVLPDTVYVGQQTTYQVAAFFDEGVRARLRRNPEFFPPDIRAVLAYELPQQPLPPRREANGRCYEVPVYQRALFPLEPGALTLPSARLVYSMSRAYSFFSGEESRELRTPPRRITVLEPPADGRPDDFTGVVGDIALTTRIDTVALRVGDPIAVAVAVSGTGNVKLFPRPALPLAWGTAVPADERVVLDSSSRVVRGTKEFEWIVTPRREGMLELPAIRYPYFDPVARQYAVALSTPATLLVAPRALPAMDTARES